MAKSIKHTRNFKYTRHNRLFAGAGDNLKEMGRYIRKLRGQAAHVELRSPKRFFKDFITRNSKGKVISIDKDKACYSLTWYTRKDLGPKHG